MPDDTSPIKVEIFKIANRLKQKLGIRPSGFSADGHIDASAIEEADRLIEVLCQECPSSIGGFLHDLSDKWSKMKTMDDGPERQEIGREVFTISHEIKDISAMCGYDLIAHFAESLRDYVDQTELSLDAQRIIIQAHIDAITVAHKQSLKESGGDMAEELKKLVKIAIDKYS